MSNCEFTTALELLAGDAKRLALEIAESMSIEIKDSEKLPRKQAVEIRRNLDIAQSEAENVMMRLELALKFKKTKCPKDQESTSNLRHGLNSKS